MKKMWGLMVYLSHNQWLPLEDNLNFEDDFWDYLLEKSVENGINAILLDVGDGVKYESHPEISMADAWSRERVKAEVEKCRKLGIALIPKVNFSTGHNFWMREYRRTISSKTYYEFCHDIINEIYEMFEKPEYIHIGMDEETVGHQSKSDYVVVRKGELLINDLKFLIDEVNKTGAMPMMWHDIFFDYSEEFAKKIKPEEVILMPWYYFAFKKEHYTNHKWWLDQRGINPEDDEEYKSGIVWTEDGEWNKNFRKTSVEVAKYGYKYVPTASVWGKNEYNTDELMEHFKKITSDDLIVGYMTAPWRRTLNNMKADFDESFRVLKEAREKHYGK